MSDSDNLNQFTIENLSYEKFVHLDSAGVQALNLFSNSGTMSKTDSMLGIFDKCRTPHGHRLVLSLLHTFSIIVLFKNVFSAYIINV